MTGRRGQPALVGLAVTVALLAGACGDDDTSARGPTTTDTTTIDTTTTPPTTVTTTAPSSTAPDGPQASGSGCTPGPGDLPDGRWYGEVDAASAGSLSFDLACWFVGEDAVVAAADDGEESPPPNDYYVRNENPATRDVAVDPTATVKWYPEGLPDGDETVDYADWVAQRSSRPFQLAVWLEVHGGVVTSIEEQWVP